MCGTLLPFNSYGLHEPLTVTSYKLISDHCYFCYLFLFFYFAFLILKVARFPLWSVGQIPRGSISISWASCSLILP